MKTYHLQYNFLGGQRALKTTSLFEFSQALEKAIDNPHVLEGSVKIWTEDKP